MSGEQDRIEAARRGDTAAWEELMRAHQQAVFRLAYLLLGDGDDAEDVAQETFVRASRALGRFDSNRPLRPWLLRITTNLCHNWQRSARRYLGALNHLLRSQQPAADARQQAETRLEAELLWQGVRRLRPEDQQVIYLRYFLDCSEAETAQVLQIAAGTVKSRHHRALARLRAVLQRDYPHLAQEKPDVI